MGKDTESYFVKKLLGFSLGPIISAFIGVITTTIITWLVIPEELGKAAMFTMALSLTSLFLYLGVDRAFIREYSGSNDKKTLLLNCSFIPFIFSFVVLLIYILFYSEISYLIFNSNEKFIMYVLACSLPFMVIDNFNKLLIRSEEKAKLYSFIIVLEKIISLPLLIVVLVFINTSFKAIVFVQVFAMIITVIVATLINRKYWFNKFRLDKEVIINALKYGIPYVPAIIFMWGLNSMDKMALRTWSNFYELGLYSVAFKIVLILAIIKQSFSSFWTPVAYRWYEEQVNNKKFIKVSEKLTTLLVLIFGIIVIFKDYIILIFGPSYREAAIMIPFLLFVILMETIGYVTGSGINFKKKTIYNTLATGIAALINLIGNYLLVPVLDGLGASISTGISFIVYFLIRTYISRKLWFKYSLKFYYINVGLMLLLASVSVFLNNKIIEILIFILITIYDFEHIKYLFQLALRIMQSLKTKEV